MTRWTIAAFAWFAVQAALFAMFGRDNSLVLALGVAGLAALVGYGIFLVVRSLRAGRRQRWRDPYAHVDTLAESSDKAAK